jgi:hypothetical protein
MSGWSSRFHRGIRRKATRSSFDLLLRQAQRVTAANPEPRARMVGEFRQFQQLSREFVEVSVHLCRLRPVEDESRSA